MTIFKSSFLFLPSNFNHRKTTRKMMGKGILVADGSSIFY